ncbi:iron-containing alcohol dehydrogenase [Thiospirochaeta perfilievii]|uniref:Iron-containing alcohol dehydrogenase n=1 Tax=Thiospirochaeta perfilievii TaxID=252967 RepID=A0A5C1QBC4_9SPIO|nr:iron-containing alcohol dehydrogenase [Thiospirochaeta perfilievii]QEN04678.1 iron-containing alcohol dehydrogenase [Thiospirochaeta perfilievii]
MNNFTFYNPTKILFGKETISNLSSLVPSNKKVIIIYGGGSIKSNGVYEQVINNLKNHDVVEFAGIESNPTLQTCMKAVDVIKSNNVSFILAVGGGSVIDAVKFIAAAAVNNYDDPWQSIVIENNFNNAMEYGSVLTLPATGSEMNCSAVISNSELGEKMAFSNSSVYPKFSILDPSTTFSLPSSQVANGVVDAYVHVLEQYLTTDINTPVQDRWAEGLLLTLIDQGRYVIDNPNDYEGRANLMWAATSALNGYIGVGVDQDWSTHMIGHEITAAYGVDHARSLAIVLPGLLSIQRKQKEKKLLQYAKRVWGVTQGDKNVIIDEVITRTTLFFQSVGISSRFVDYDINPEEAAEKIGNIFIERGQLFGENRDISGELVKKILLNRQCLY